VAQSPRRSPTPIGRQTAAKNPPRRCGGPAARKARSVSKDRTLNMVHCQISALRGHSTVNAKRPQRVFHTIYVGRSATCARTPGFPITVICYSASVSGANTGSSSLFARSFGDHPRLNPQAFGTAWSASAVPSKRAGVPRARQPGAYPDYLDSATTQDRRRGLGGPERLIANPPRRPARRNRERRPFVDRNYRGARLSRRRFGRLLTPDDDFFRVAGGHPVIVNQRCLLAQPVSRPIRAR